LKNKGAINVAHIAEVICEYQMDNKGLVRFTL
jgi:hypothetical protein